MSEQPVQMKTEAGALLMEAGALVQEMLVRWSPLIMHREDESWCAACGCSWVKDKEEHHRTCLTAAARAWLVKVDNVLKKGTL